MSKILKKSIAIFTSVTTIAWLSGIAMLAPVMVSAQTVSDGDLIRNPNAAGDAKFDIYIVKKANGEDYKRLILNPQVFESYGHLEWDDVMDVSASTMAQYETSNFVYPDNDGDGMADGAVYYLTPDGDTGSRQHVEVSASEFSSEYSWNSVYVINSTDFGNYTEGSPVTEVPISEDDDDDDEPGEGTLSVNLAADTPASSIVIYGSIRNPFTTFTVTANGDDVTIDSMKVKRAGVGQDSAFSGVNIVDESTHQTVSDTDKTLNSSHEANITDDVTISEGETKKFTIVGSMTDTTTYGGETPILQLQDITLKGDATLSAGLPIVGNSMTINNTINLGTLTAQRGSYTNATTSSSNPTEVGATNLTVYSLQLTAPSNEDVEFKYLKLYNEGSIGLDSDVEDIALYNATNGNKLADGVVDGNYVHFDLYGDPFVIDEGQEQQFKVTLDVTGGSSRTLQMEIYRSTDLVVKGQTYDSYFTPTYSGTGSGPSAPYLTDNEFYVGTGTFTVRKSSEVGNANISINSGQELGAFLFDVEGEPLEVSAFTVNISSTTSANKNGALQSVKLVEVGSGDVVAGPNDHADGSTEIAWTDTFTVPVGETHYKVVGTLMSNKGWSTDDVITVEIDNPSTKITAEGETTGQSITSGTTSKVSGNQQTVKAAYLSISRNSVPGNKTVIVGTTDVDFGAWTFDATNSGEDVRVTQLKFAGRGNAATNTSNQHVYMDGEMLDGGNPSTLDGSSTVPASTTFTFSNDVVIPAGESKTITLKGDKTSVGSNDNEKWGLTDISSTNNSSVVAYGKTSGSRITTDLTPDDGAEITSAASGSLDVSLNGAPAKSIVIGGASEQLVNKVSFQATNSDIEIQKLYITASSTGSINGTVLGDHSEVEKIYLKVDGSYIGNSDGYNINKKRTTINLDSNEFVIPSNDDKDLEIYADIANVSDSQGDGLPGDANAAFKVSLAGPNSVDAIDSTDSTATVSTMNATSSAFVLHKAKPVVAISDNTDSTNQDGTYTLFETDITAEEGKVSVYRLTMLTSTTASAGIAVKDGYLRLSSCSGCKVGNTIVASGDNITATMASGNDANGDAGTKDYWDFVFDNQDTSGVDEEALQIPEGQTATIQFRASVSGLSTSGESIRTKLLGDGSATSTNDTSGDRAKAFTALNQGNFVWSDLFYDEIGSDTTSSKQWYNGYLVNNIDNATSTEVWTLGYDS